MAVPISEIDAANIRFPCSRHELVRAVKNRSGSPKGVDPGAIWFWGLAIAQLPSGCVVANGKANAKENGGSGVDCTNRFIKCVTTNAENLQLLPAEPTTGDSRHTHEAVVDYRTITGNVAFADPDISNTLTSGTHEHSGQTEFANPFLQFAGAHFHEGSVDEKLVILEDAGDHDHTEALVSGDGFIDPHSCEDVANGIGTHTPHKHDIHKRDALDYRAGVDGHSSHSLTTGNEDIPLTHESSGGPPIEHTPNPHTHGVTQDTAGEHKHFIRPHKHRFVTDVDGVHGHWTDMHDHGLQIYSGGEHFHSVSGGLHSHKATFNPHTHAAFVSFDGQHQHDMGEPAAVNLIPVEVLP